jgi:hypothetical protein
VSSRRRGDSGRGDIVRIYITREAYQLLGQYMFSRYGTYRGMVRVASELLIKAIRSESGEASSQLAQIAQKAQQYQRDSETSGPISPNSPLSQKPSKQEERPRKPSPLDEVEDLEVIRARKPEALRRTAEERGLKVRDLGEDGYPGLVAVYKQSFADFAKTVAETEKPTLQQVEERAQRALRRGKLASLDEKVAVMLFILNREGEILWDGSRWVEPGRARPAPPLQEQLRQLREQQRAETTAVSTEKPPAQQPQQVQQPAPQPQQPQPDERIKRWLELFEKEFPHLKTAMLVWSVKDAEALRRLAEQHGLVYYAITAEKAVILRREYVKDACAYANERKWTREAVADMVANTLRAKPHVLSGDEIAALALEAALSLGLAEWRGGGWIAK